MLSVVINRLMWFIMGDCSAASLRMTNWLALVSLAFVALQCRRLLEARAAERDSDGHASRPGALSIYAVHTGVNAALFPLLFFFSGLYYTDVFSSLVVLAAFWNHLARVGSRPPLKSWRSDALVVVLGVASLCMRQTNVFWVVVFLGGLEAVHAVRSIRPPKTNPGQFDRQTMVKFYIWRYSKGEVHDPLLNEAGFEGKLPRTCDPPWGKHTSHFGTDHVRTDVFLCVLSLAIAVVGNPLRVLKQIWAHILVMALFAGFVLWNGSVVLGTFSPNPRYDLDL